MSGNEQSESMSFWLAVWNCIYKKYAVFSGRASRREFLAYLIFYAIFFILWISLIFELIDFFGDVNLIDFVMGYALVFLFPPLVAVAVRRFHDCSKSGWLILLLAIPLINLFGFALLCRKGDRGANRYGPKPPRMRF